MPPFTSYEKLLDRLTLQFRRALLSADPSHVHNLRVAIRRYRQALDMLEDCPAIRNMHRRLRRIMRLAGDVRDCDITAKLIGDQQRPAGLHLRRENARRRLSPALASWLERKTAAKWRETLLAFAQPAPGPVLRKCVQRLFERARSRNESMKALHRLRIAAKKLRYSMEIAGKTDQLKDVKKLQKHLGLVQDYQAALRILAEEGASTKIAEDLEHRQREEVKVFRHLWSHAFKGRRKEWLRSLA